MWLLPPQKPSTVAKAANKSQEELEQILSSDCDAFESLLVGTEAGDRSKMAGWISALQQITRAERAQSFRSENTAVYDLSRLDVSERLKELGASRLSKLASESGIRNMNRLDEFHPETFDILAHNTAYLALDVCGLEELSRDLSTVTVEAKRVMDMANRYQKLSSPNASSPGDSGTETLSQENARKLAQSYLSVLSFSREGLISQLQYEGFSRFDATYGVDATPTNWNEQAAKKAREYLDVSAFSRDGLYDQLIYEGFTPIQARYGLSAVGY